MSDSCTSSHCLVRGSINIDEFFHVPSVVQPGETLSSTSFERRGGGKGANQAIAVARAGGKVSLLGAVGLDGAWLVEDLKQSGVFVTDIITTDQEPTGRAIIQLTPEGENCIILHRGANYADHPALSIADSQLRYTHLLLQNEIPFSSTLAYLAHSYRINATSLFNPSPLPSRDQLQAFPWAQVDWLIVNEGEAMGILRSFTSEMPSISQEQKSECEAVLRTIHSHPSFSPSVNIVCTLGASGVLALLPAKTDSADPIVIHIPAAKLDGNVLDTTGAGDCFTGYFVTGLMELEEKQTDAGITEEQLGSALKRAAEAAGLCVQRSGAMESIPPRAEVDLRLL